jgi:hypothetical protein
LTFKFCGDLELASRVIGDGTSGPEEGLKLFVASSGEESTLLDFVASISSSLRVTEDGDGASRRPLSARRPFLFVLLSKRFLSFSQASKVRKYERVLSPTTFSRLKR